MLRHEATLSLVGHDYFKTLDLEQIYTQYASPVYQFLYTRVGNREDAEDLTSQVFLKAFGRLDTARPEKSIAAWLFAVARTVLTDHWRREYRHGKLAELHENLEGPAGPSDTPDDTERVQCVDRVLAVLSPRYRAVLELRFLRGYTIDETAQTLGITPVNVKVIQHRALARAAEVMEIESGDGSVSITSAKTIA